jgi:hypothetical protein
MARRPVALFLRDNRPYREVTASCIVLAILVAVPLKSQSDPPVTLQFGSATLRLGMSRAAVVSALSAYDVDDNVVRSKGGPPFDVVGTLAFDANNRLTFAARSWGPSDQQAGVEISESLFDALEHIHWSRSVSITTMLYGLLV